MAEIDFPSWQKIEMIVGKILKAEDIENADKMYKLKVDLGKLGKRTLVAGIKKHYDKDELKGKRCIVLANLTPRIMKGIKSEGMILAAVNEDFRNLPKEEISESARESEDSRHESEIRLVQPDDEIELGSRVR